MEIRLLHLSYWLTLLTIAISLVLGIAAAVLGGDLIALGSGPGGLYGLPDVGFILAILLATPAFLLGVGRLLNQKGNAAITLPLLATLVIAASYIVIAHSLDPCDDRVWDSTTRLGDIPLCEWFGPELNIHTRFHLLWHVLPTLPLVAGYVVVWRRFVVGSSRHD